MRLMKSVEDGLESARQRSASNSSTGGANTAQKRNRKPVLNGRKS